MPQITECESGKFAVRLKRISIEYGFSAILYLINMDKKDKQDCHSRYCQQPEPQKPGNCIISSKKNTRNISVVLKNIGMVMEAGVNCDLSKDISVETKRSGPLEGQRQQCKGGESGYQAEK
ncbi:hypothetical protein KJ966_05075 [bacterium]|nr:hypothetical protein [bacterium]